jgi:tetratricopeptide (TPR) repeat protein
MYMRALEGKEAALGPKHTSTLSTVNNLGNLYANQGKLGEAEAMFLQALQGYKESLGADQIRTYLPALNTMGNMGELFAQLGQTNKGPDVFRSALWFRCDPRTGLTDL